mmetsp:Transcript_39429/g.93504  ORF Transcript_39429/g.93504 Transcript_39429/m.93504 type:complete len:200 (-) Transcript_39429:756-1355(-)
MHSCQACVPQRRGDGVPHDDGVPRGRRDDDQERGTGARGRGPRRASGKDGRQNLRGRDGDHHRQGCRGTLWRDLRSAPRQDRGGHICHRCRMRSRVGAAARARRPRSHAASHGCPPPGRMLLAVDGPQSTSGDGIAARVDRPRFGANGAVPRVPDRPAAADDGPARAGRRRQQCRGDRLRSQAEARACRALLIPLLIPE